MARATRKLKSRDTESESSVAKRVPKGLKKLSEEADKAIGESSPAITKKMAEIASNGDLLYTDYLVGLAEKGAKPQRKSRAKREMSLAERWMNEPEWQGMKLSEQIQQAKTRREAEAKAAEEAEEKEKAAAVAAAEPVAG